MASTEAHTIEFSLVGGGLLYRIERATGLARGERRDVLRLSAVVWLVAWLPLLIIAAVEWTTVHRVSGVLLDFSAQARPLVIAPLFLFAEYSLDERTRHFTRRLVELRLVGDEDMPRLRHLLDGAARRRDAVVVEVVLLFLAFSSSQAVLWGLGAPLGLTSRHALGNRPVGAWLWYGFVTLPLFQFLLYRWAWRWWIWVRVLWGISRLPLRLMPTHPDRAGGLKTIQETLVGFAWVQMGLSAILSASWCSRVVFDGARAQDFAADFVGFVLIALLLTVGPLTVFARPLWKARRSGIWQYGHLALRYTRLFHHRWIEVGSDEGLLGTQDLQALADLGTSYQVVEDMQVVPFSRMFVIFVLVSVVIPMVPLILSAVPMSELLKRLGGILLKGPG